VGLCEEGHPDVALLRYVGWQQVAETLGWANPDFNLAFDIARRLKEVSLLDKRGGLGQRIDVCPTYAGVSSFTSLNSGLGGWQPSASRYVSFYDHRGSGWHLDGPKYTGSNGTTSYLRIYAPSHRYFRVHVLATKTIWDHTSSSIYR
jgi:hypothetical protein